MSNNEGANAAVARRSVLKAVALGGVAVAGTGVAGCGTGSDDAGAGPVGTDPAPTAQGSASTTPAESPSAPDPLSAADEVPVAGGVVLKGDEIVVTQPEKGTFKAFTAVCTHSGCLVNSVADGVISCPCHGSQFSIADGSVVAGPAPTPLAEVEVQVKGGNVVRA